MRRCAWIALFLLCSCAGAVVQHYDPQHMSELEPLKQAWADPHSVSLERLKLLVRSNWATVDAAGFVVGGFPRDDEWMMDHLRTLGEEQGAKLIETNGRLDHKPTNRRPLVIGGLILGAIGGVAAFIGVYNSTSRGLGDIGLIPIAPLITGAFSALGAGLGYLVSMAFELEKVPEEEGWRQSVADAFNRALQDHLLRPSQNR